MHESVNELLKTRRTVKGKMLRERCDQGTGKRQRGKARWEPLEKCQVTSGVVNISRRETSRGDERKKMIWEGKLIERK